MSTLKVDTLNGSTGSTITVPSGQTLAVAGTLTTTGTFNPTADISVSGNISNDGVQIIDNTISASRTNDDLEISASGTGKVKIGVLKFPTSDGSSDQVLKTDGSGNLSFATLSSTSISQNNTNVTASDSGSDGTVTITCDGNTEMTVTDDGVRVHGNLTVDGTQTIINTSTLSVEDNIIEVNRNVSSNAGMPTLSGLKVNRGEGSSSTEQDLFWVWDESFADDGTTIFGNSGGAFTAFKSANDGASAATLVDIRANIVHAIATGAQYSDVAERFASDTSYTPGTVVCLGGAAEITAVNEEASDEVFGVVSGEHQAAFKMNGGAGSDATHPYIAMTGRVDVKVIGTVNKGDRLISASVPGYAKAAIKADCTAFNVIGRALADKTTSGHGTVLAAVRTSH